MYSTCLFCSHALGRNEVVETFPVGRRLAFDAAKGRLWVVCATCRRWNLTPVEERWESIETCERLFRDTRLRVCTEHIGLAKLREGLELVRIGAPQRPEFAAWRYGDQLGRRRRRQFALAGLGFAAAGAMAAGAIAAGPGLVFTAVMLANLNEAALRRAGTEKVVAAIPSPGRRATEVTRADLATTKIIPGQDGHPFGIRLIADERTHIVHGAGAARLAAKLMPYVNRFGGTRSVVSQAVGGIEAAGGPHAYLAKLAEHRARQRRFRVNHLGGDVGEPADQLTSLPPIERVAIEMAVHEEQERRALEGELAELERAWQDAEEIAGISDNLLLPPSVESVLARLRRAL